MKIATVPILEEMLGWTLQSLCFVLSVSVVRFSPMGVLPLISMKTEVLGARNFQQLLSGTWCRGKSNNRDGIHQFLSKCPPF